MQSAPATQRAIDNNKLNRAIRTAARMTDWNDHTGARRTYSKLFGYDDLTARYDELSRLHMEAGHLTSDLRDVRDAIDETMYGRIRRDYGEDMLRRIERGL